MCQSAATIFAHRLLPQPCTQQQNPPRRRKAELAGLGRGSPAALGEPPFQAGQAADLADRHIDRDRLQAAGRGEEVSLGLDDPRDVVRGQGLVVVDRRRDHPPRRGQRQPPQDLHDALQVASGQRVRDIVEALRLDLAEGLAHQLLQVGRTGQRKVERHRQPPQGIGQRIGIDQHHRHPLGQVQFAELPHHRRIAGVRPDVLEDVDRVLQRLIADVVQRGRELAAGNQARARGGHGPRQPAGDAPFEHGLAQFRRRPAQEGDGPELVLRHDRDKGVIGTDEELELVEHNGTRQGTFRQDSTPGRDADE
jgi:hypothetical protein